MVTRVPVTNAPTTPTTDQFRVRLLVLVSALFLLVQVALTDYGPGEGGAAWLWFCIGAVLLWLTYRRRSRVARGFVVVTALTGTVVYVLMIAQGAHALLLAALYLGQALPLLSGPVRRHVQSPGSAR